MCSELFKSGPFSPEKFRSVQMCPTFRKGEIAPA
jgi:hypothetical protein